jgi:small subunit ribosomal protein S6e
MKIVYSDPKTGRTAQLEIDAEKASALLSSKINDVIEGTIIGLHGYKLKITGGSDKSGFPLMKGIGGAIKTSAMKRTMDSGRNRGQYRRFTVRGSAISADTEQINTVIVEYGTSPSISELFPEKAKAEAPKGAEAAAK